MNRDLEELVELFEEANRRFIDNNERLFEIDVNERTLCGALLVELYKVLYEYDYSDYYVDVEYNRRIRRTGKEEDKVYIKSVSCSIDKSQIINCDLIVHGRGKLSKHDNLIALEMKKTKKNGELRRPRKDTEEISDRDRLMVLTESERECNRGNINHFFGYELGVFYKVNHYAGVANAEYYSHGKHIDNSEDWLIPKARKIHRVK